MTTTAHHRALPSWGRPGGQGADETQRRPRPARAHAPHLALAAAFMAAYTLSTTARYRRYNDSSWDLGIFVQVARGWATGHIPVVDIKGEGFLILGDHWSPILAVLGPLWRLWPSPAMLLVLQAGLFACSAAVVSETAARFLGRNRGLIVGTAYGLSWGLQWALDVQFHEIAFAVPLLAVVGRQLLLRRWTRAACWSLPLLLVKEDLGLTVAAVGVLLLVNRRWRLGPALLALGLAWTACAVWWWIPHFNTGDHFSYWTGLPGHRGDHDWGGFALSLVTRHAVWTTVVWLAGVTGFLALRSPLAVLAVPTLAWRFTSDVPAYWGQYWHYSAVLMPVLFLAAVDGVERCEGTSRAWVRTWALHAVPVMLAVAVTCTVAGGLPVSALVAPETYRGGPHAAALRAGLRVVPDGATVESASMPLAHLAARARVFWPNGLVSVPPQFIVTEDDREPGMVAAQAGAGHPGHVYRVVFHRETVTVVQLVR